jgi:hypothetical protein
MTTPKTQTEDEKTEDSKTEQRDAIAKDAGSGQASARRKPAQTPSVGRIVHFLDREMAVHAENLTRSRRDRGLDDGPVVPEVFAATITRVHRDGDGRPTGTVGLEIHNPELGPQIARDVPYAAEYTAGHWSWPPYVP